MELDRDSADRSSDDAVNLKFRKVFRCLTAQSLKENGIALRVEKSENGAGDDEQKEDKHEEKVKKTL